MSPAVAGAAGAVTVLALGAIGRAVLHAVYAERAMRVIDAATQAQLDATRRVIQEAREARR